MSLLTPGADSTDGRSAAEQPLHWPTSPILLRSGAFAFLGSAVIVAAVVTYQNGFTWRLSRVTFDAVLLGASILVSLISAAMLLVGAAATRKLDTQRQQADARTRGVIRQLSVILEHIPAGVAVIDRKQRLVLRNSRYDELLVGTKSAPLDAHTGFDARDAQGKPYARNGWPSSRALHNGETVSDEEIQLRHQDGRMTWFTVSAAPVADQDGDLDGAVIVFNDATERIEQTQERTRLMREIIEVQEVERLRIARELHDDFGQQLTVLDLQLRQLVDHEAAKELAQPLERLGGVVDALQEKLRDLTWSLRPLALDDFGLPAALADLAALWSENLGLLVDLHVDEQAIFAKETSIVVFRVVQEALTNIARHAEASSVSITVQTLGGTTRLVVEDNGKGFAPEQLIGQTHHFGLTGMRERLAMVGGSFEVESEPGHGTRIVGSIPNKEAA